MAPGVPGRLSRWSADRRRTDDRGPGTNVRRRNVVWAIVIVVLGAAAAFAWSRIPSGDELDDREDAATVAAGGPPGTPLLDGFVVAPGSTLVGPVVIDEVDTQGRPQSWFAVLAVEGDPATVWEAYATQLDDYSGVSGAAPTEAPGCVAGSAQPGDDVCAMTGYDARFALRSVPGDVVSGYVIHLAVGGPPAGDDVAPGDGTPLPDPQPARQAPSVGGPLAPETTAYDGDDGRYVLVEGSALVRQYGRGSLTGGFAVMLQVDEGADLYAVTRAYVEQATQDTGAPGTEPTRTDQGGTTTRTYRPPGGAGGYSGTVWSVDRPPGQPDWIAFELAND